MPFFENDGVHLFYLVEGYGQVILLLHSWACDMHDWSYQIPMLVNRGFTTITLDVRGHGRSTMPDNKDYSLTALARDVTALLTHLGVDHAVLVGHSTGAVVASVVALNHPEIVRGLVLIEPTYYLTQRERLNLVEGLQTTDSPERAASLFARALYTPDTPAHLKAWHMRRARSTPAEAVSLLLAQVFDAESVGLWENMVTTGSQRAGPRLVVCSNHSAAEKELSLGVTDLDRVRLFSAGAWPHQQASEQVNSLLADWFDACDLHG